MFLFLLEAHLKNKGVQLLLDAVVDYLPSPLDIEDVTGFKPGDEENELSRSHSDEDPFSALAFKVVSDPHVGKLTYFRVYSGTLNKGDKVTNTTTGKEERLGRILRMHSNSREDIDFYLCWRYCCRCWFKKCKNWRYFIRFLPINSVRVQ